MVTEPLCGREWLKEHEIQKCIRCGQCCIRVPCIWAQITAEVEYNRKLKQGDVCPYLKRKPDKTFNCRLFRQLPEMRKEMLATGCEDTKWRDNPIPIYQDLIVPPLSG